MEYVMETPQHLKDTTERDVFEEIFDTTFGEYAEELQATAWRAYRLRMIGSCDVDEWIQVCKDRMEESWKVYLPLLQAAASTNPGDLRSFRADSKSVITREDMPDTVPAGNTVYASTRDTDAREASEEDGLIAERLQRLKRAYPDFMRDMIEELETIFVNRW